MQLCIHKTQHNLPVASAPTTTTSACTVNARARRDAAPTQQQSSMYCAACKASEAPLSPLKVHSEALCSTPRPTD